MKETRWTMPAGKHGTLSAKRDVFRIFLLLVLFAVEVISLYFSHCHNPILRVSITQFYR